MNELKIEYLSPEELTPYENNTRKHAPADIEQIKKAILDEGFNDPIGIWGEKNLIVEGHGRQIAALELHLEKVPVIRLDHMTDAQRRKYAIDHNRTAELSGWDFETLQEEIAALEIEGYDFSGLNFEFGKEIDWSNVDEIGEHNYEKPESDKLRCPICGGIDEKIRFVKV
jgi:ParB-like chromosome segregation protein Spo0J